MTTWILLRGLTRELRHWGDFPRQLALALPEAQVVPLELPGSGELNDKVCPMRIQDLASFCHLETVRRGLTPPYVLLAMSMGGMVATAWAGEHPEEVAGCVLINTSFGGFSPVHHRLRPRAWLGLLGILLDRTPEGRERRILGLTSGNPDAHAEVVAAWAAISRSRPVSPGNALRQLLAASRYRAPRSAPVPTLILSGAADGLVDPRCSRIIAQRWQCALAIHPGAGHDLPLDDGAWVAAESKSWFPAHGG